MSFDSPVTSDTTSSSDEDHPNPTFPNTFEWYWVCSACWNVNLGTKTEPNVYGRCDRCGVHDRCRDCKIIWGGTRVVNNNFFSTHLEQDCCHSFDYEEAACEADPEKDGAREGTGDKVNDRDSPSIEARRSKLDRPARKARVMKMKVRAEDKWALDLMAMAEELEMKTPDD